MTKSKFNIVYNGEIESGVHNWQSIGGSHYYWHPDWLHIAEDITGHKAVTSLDKDKNHNKDSVQAELTKHIEQK
ncbi:hypothetical protein D5018_05130 [Parashewanella curva]|uniref:Uncharacterized protein n=1 Tax=Parashewanella curva TaxID=2338552 RepID=A0A3L8Q2W2_9GAMM|nr:hypothetical protein [Parashewanella curva]RLV60852.1 hypothetical protein D5018_05130 [Parashewanella curva]